MSAHFESIKAFLKLPISKKATASQIPFPVRILPSILQLLAAEQEAQQIVNAARNAKMARLKQAKEEAEKELGAFRARMEAEFQRKLAESSGDSGTNVKRLEKETEVKIHHQKNEAGRISHDVVQMLLKYDGEELRSPRSLVNYKW